MLIFLQIVLESFPISSSGHVLLIKRIFFDAPVSSLSTVFDVNSYETMVWEYTPTVFVVALFFARDWFFLLRTIRRTWRITVKLILFMLCSNVVTSLCFIIVRNYKIEIPLWLGFSITTMMLLSLMWCSRPLRILTGYRALILGLIQGMAWLPGVSRFASVFVASRWMGINNRRAWRITWMLEWPMTFGVSMLSLAHYLGNPTHSISVINSLPAVTLASMLAFGGMMLMSFLIHRNTLWMMGIYTLLPFFVSFIHRL